MSKQPREFVFRCECMGGTTWTVEHQWAIEGEAEEVVRCKDCDYRRRSWNGRNPNFTSHYFCAYTGGHEVKPDGFCAWGERRDA